MKKIFLISLLMGFIGYANIGEETNEYKNYKIGEIKNMRRILIKEIKEDVINSQDIIKKFPAPKPLPLVTEVYAKAKALAILDYNELLVRKIEVYSDEAIKYIASKGLNEEAYNRSVTAVLDDNLLGLIQQSTVDYINNEIYKIKGLSTTAMGAPLAPPFYTRAYASTISLRIFIMINYDKIVEELGQGSITFIDNVNVILTNFYNLNKLFLKKSNANEIKEGYNKLMANNTIETKKYISEIQLFDDLYSEAINLLNELNNTDMKLPYITEAEFISTNLRVLQSEYIDLQKKEYTDKINKIELANKEFLNHLYK